MSAEGGLEAVATLREGARKRGWYVRLHKPYELRVHTAPAPRPLLAGRGVITYNIGTSKGKLEELAEILAVEQVAVAALQETLRTDNQRELRIRDFMVLEHPMDSTVPGARGVALAVRVGVPAHAIGGIATDPCALWARVIGLSGGNECWTVASTYVPHTGPALAQRRKQVLDHIRTTAAALGERYSDEPMLILGDWNMKTATLTRLLTQRWGSGLFAVPISGSAGSNTVPGRAPTDIDHIVVNNAAFQLLRGGKGKVLRGYNLSTHWPVKAEVPVTMASAVAEAGEPQPPQLVERVIRSSRLVLALSNRFDALSETLSDTIAEKGAEGAVLAFNSAAREACSDIGAVRVPRKPTAPAVRHFSRATKALMAKSREASAGLHAKGKMTSDPVRLAAARAARQVARAAQKADVARTKQKRLAAAVAGLYDGLRPEVFWRYIRDEVEGPRVPASSVPPVRDSNGALKVIPAEIRAEWAKHYSDLSKATDGRRDRSWWAEHHPLPSKSALAMMDAPIEWPEIVRALKATPSGTAPGADGIPAGLLKAALTREDGSSATAEDSAPETPLGDVILRIANAIFDAGVPASLACATVVNVPKHGSDPTDKDGYRGVSLISATLKLVDRVMGERVYDGMVERRRIRREQAGFRKVEEAMAQVCALVETLGRRARVGKPTYLAFIDFRKAFDSVSHGALMHRLHSEGVRGKTLRFFESQYASPTLRVRVGGALSAAIALEVGVRQGAPSSPVLFDIFIDSILDEMAGVLVPGLPADEQYRIMAGLLFADDVVLTQESPEDMVAALAKLSAWADKWGMRVNNRKCGVMVVGDAAAQAAAKLRVWTLQGDSVPVVDFYKYLGVVIDFELNFKKNAETRVANGRKALFAVRWLLVDPDIPLVVKAMLYKTLVHPVLCFGGELLGLSRATRVGSLQSLQNKAVRWMVTGSSKATMTPIAPLLAELGLPPVGATQAGAKVRAMVKYPLLQTWAGPLSRKRSALPLRAGSAPLWSCRSKGSATRRLPGWRGMKHKAAGRAMVKASSVSYLKRHAGTSVGAKAYLRFRFVDTRGYLRHSVRYPNDATAVAWLTRARAGTCWSGHVAAAAGVIPAKFRRSCIACGRKVKDSLSHLLLRCPSYRSLTGELASTLLAARSLASNPLHSRSRRDRRVLGLLLGGSIRRDGHRVSLSSTWLPAGKPGKEAAAKAGGEPGNGISEAHREDPRDVPISAGSVGAGGVEGGAGVDPLAASTPAYITVARAIRSVMEAHHRRIRLERQSSESSNGNNGAPRYGSAPSGGGRGRHRRRANAWERAGQLLLTATAPDA